MHNQTKNKQTNKDIKKTRRTAIEITREKDFNKWYQEVIKVADLAENSSVRGCMIMKPSGYAIWENIQTTLNIMIKEKEVQNAYFPLLIPLSSIQQEADHVEGFAKECAVVTHHRLITSEKGKLEPAGKLEEPYIIRPTSEMVIGESFSRWINSYKDLPLKINQWANVMRWEMRPRIFLRTSEFLWQEGHTAHASKQEALEQTIEMINMYKSFVEDFLAIAVIVGEKTESERFPGAENTFSIEALMQDGKALQAGTSHFLGQKFSKAQKISFLNSKGDEKLAWTTSWGVSTRLIGGMIMSHGDDDGLIIPPRIAQYHIKILPIFRNDNDKQEIMEYIKEVEKSLKELNFVGEKLRVYIDWRDMRGGEKYWEAVKSGVPIIIEIGKRDMAKNQLAVTRRDIGVGDKQFIKKEIFMSNIVSELTSIQSQLLMRSRQNQQDSIVNIASEEQLTDFLRDQPSPFKLGLAYLKDCSEVVDYLATEKVTMRCIPLTESQNNGECLITKQKVKGRVLIGHSY